MKIYVGVTDYDWYSILKQQNCDEVNFWKPGGKTNFKAISTNDMFLFKLHSPNDYIVGGGFFVRFSILPTFLAWDAFGVENGTNNLKELNDRVNKYKKRIRMDDSSQNIGCIILTEPFFFEEKEWIPVPKDWSSSIVQGKTYDTATEIGNLLYQQVCERLQRQPVDENSVLIAESNGARYGKDQLVSWRLGQGAFRVVVTEAYHRKCSITGEKTLPVLDAAHIKPFSENGPNIPQNGILLRSDVHILYDKGYITINKDYHIEVSDRLNEDFGNGKMYYAYHGKKLFNIPDKQTDLPAKEYIEWHNENLYLGWNLLIMGNILSSDHKSEY